MSRSLHVDHRVRGVRETLPNRSQGLSTFELDRRAALRLFAGGAACALAACGRPAEEIVPYVEMPERMTPGVPLRFATALALAGYGRGVIVTSVEGRPIKIDGNPRHPASLGATDIFAEASVLSLYDPDRSKAVRKGTAILPWTSFEAALLQRIEEERSRQGAGLAILTGRVTSPTLVRQLDALLQSFPQAKWYRYEPVDDDAARAGAMLAFGRPLTALPRLGDARAALMLDADPLGFGPEQIRFSRDLIGARRSRSPDEFLRIYAVEPSWTLTGAAADHHLPLPHQLISNVALTVARALGASVPDAPLPAEAQHFAEVAAADLKSRSGRAMVLAGPRQPAEVHALCHWINAELHAPIDFIAPVDPVAMGHGESLRALTDDIGSGKTKTLIVIGANPAYDAPGDLKLAIETVPFTAHLGLYEDETAARCTWHLPQSHPLETWSDLRAFDGTGSIVQPLIAPLYDTRTAHQLVALLGGTLAPSSRDLVRQTWQSSFRSHGSQGDFEEWWRQTLQDGVVANSTSPLVAAPAARLPQITTGGGSQGLTLTLAPDPSIGDGSFANNAWLQECPKPFTKQVWGNALHISEVDARNLGAVDGDVVRLTSAQLAIEMPVLVRPGQANGTISATLGYGRKRAGAIGNGIGFDLYGLRNSKTPWATDGVALSRVGRQQNLLLTQHFFELDADHKDLQPRLDLAQLAGGEPQLIPPDANPPTLYPPHDYDTYKWGMVIDASACTGCNACVVACQSENNVPIVGPDEIAMGRDMHWLRIDDYVVDGRPGFSPVPCMHCEHAPCEPVCPVAASVHDGEGLNLQVYNRCVGTRFCQSNCPYKVRRFNFFGYADGESYASFGAETVKAVFNPDVTVRSRGVMEKCTYCIQRISGARRAAEKENRRIRDGEVVTACQAACPTRAISFGDLNNPQANVNALRHEPRAYALLGNLGTRPRTTYLARLRNPNPNLG
jgi:Fe-S-cluster-containing dehydrogenase component/anaerobic selenocysteine-containing dehydrogenase